MRHIHTDTHSSIDSNHHSNWTHGKRCILPRTRSYPSRGKIRPGWMLVELLTTMTLALVLASSSTLLVIRFLNANHSQATDVIHHRSLNLWLEQFRMDARLADSAEILPDSNGTCTIVFHQGEEKTTYSMLSQAIERHHQGVASGGWALGSGQWQFSLQMNDRLVHGEFVPEGPQVGRRESASEAPPVATESQHSIKVDAVLGRRDSGPAGGTTP